MRNPKVFRWTRHEVADTVTVLQVSWKHRQLGHGDAVVHDN